MKKTGLLLFLLLVIAIMADMTSERVLNEGYVERDGIAGEKKELYFQLDVGDFLENYSYLLEVQPMMPTKEEVERSFAETITQIELDFQEIHEKVPIKKEYLSGMVEADWSFQPYGIISQAGEIDVDKCEEEMIIDAQVKLSCGEYERIHTFSFLIKRPELSKQEYILQQIEEWLEDEMEKEGSNRVLLPSEIDGIPLIWKEKKEYVTPKIIFLEMVAIVLMWMTAKRKMREEEKRKVIELEREYPDIVSQLALLLGAGMTTRQAWNRIAMQYKFKRENGMLAEKLVYEAVLRMNRRFMEGESEREVYQNFLKEISAPSYRKLVRILLGNLEKGTQFVADHLAEESRCAFEKRILQAKKSGEEASTKMMLPLSLMLVIVMGIVMVPALIGFQI